MDREPKSVGDNEAFVRLIRAAQDKPGFRKTLCRVLRQPGFQRKSVLNTMTARMAAERPFSGGKTPCKT